MDHKDWLDPYKWFIYITQHQQITALLPQGLIRNQPYAVITMLIISKGASPRKQLW